MRTQNGLLIIGALALTLGCSLGGHSDNHDAGGAPPPAPAATTKAAPEKPAPTTKAQRTGAPNRPAWIGGCTKVYRGDTCHIQGTGFGYNEEVTVTVEGEGRPSTVVDADDNGAFAWNYNILTSPGTEITVRATGSTSGRHAEFSYTIT